MSVRLTPGGQLSWEPEPDEHGAPVPADLAPVVDAFRADWRGALFTLAAERLPVQEIPSLRYWQQLAEHYLTALCHLPADAKRVAVEPPDDSLLSTWVLNAPPMEGGEYLSPDCLRGLWGQFDEWVREAAAAAGGPGALLRKRAPRWRQVGRVCFHLAENRNDEARPFAFLATYAAGFGAGGRLKHLPLRNALQQYAGANNRAALINLLAPVEEAATACAWVRELADCGELYRPLAWSPARAYRFLQSVPDLERSGLSVRVPNWWRKRARPQVSVTIGSQTPSRVGTDAVLDFRVEVAVGDSPLSAEELETLRSAGDNLVLLRNQWVEVDRERLGQAIAHWETLQRHADGEKISFVEGMRLLAGASTDLRQEERTEAERPWVQVSAGAALRELLAGLRRPGTLEQRDLAAAAALQGTLRPYQREGLAWLHFVDRTGARRLPRRRHGAGQDHSGAGAAALRRRRRRKPARAGAVGSAGVAARQLARGGGAVRAVAEAVLPAPGGDRPANPGRDRRRAGRASGRRRPGDHHLHHAGPADLARGAALAVGDPG